MHINYWKELKKNTFGMLGLVMLILVVIIALSSPLLARYDPGEPSHSAFKPPSSEHWLGTNDVGQDIWSRLLYGAKNTLLVALGVGAFTTLISTVVGSSAALVGGLYERIMMRTVDALIAIPAFIVIILVAAYVLPNVWTLIFLISVLTWQGGARLVRAQTLSIKERMHVHAARTFGANKRYISTRHIIPDLSPILFAVFIHSATRGVFMEAGLAFLGIADISTVSWGLMMHHALRFYYLDVWKWWLLPIGLALSVTIMAFVFIGHAFETAMDPRLRVMEREDWQC
ncbi:MAG: ABC transporter permease [Halobacteriota archaeon]